MQMQHVFNLARFVDAQAGAYAAALNEIRHGRKRTHWMWFVFPQIAGLGRSDMAMLFAISSLGEAQAYLAHPVLGQRLYECVDALQALVGVSAQEVFGQVDAAKLRSSLTLFAQAGGAPIIEAALLRWFGSADPLTLEILKQQGGSEA